MNSTTRRSTDTDVNLAGNALRALLIRAFIIALVPTVLAAAWLLALREPTLQADSIDALAKTAVEFKAELIADYSRDAMARTEHLAAALSSDSPEGELNPLDVGFPDARSVLVLPLDDMGTVNMEPGSRGIKSHIGIDLVRRAFAGELPQAEAVLNGGSGYTLLARAYGRPLAGVVLVELDTRRLAELVAPATSGRFELTQRLGTGPAQTVAGSLNNSPARASAPVAGTPWQLSFAPAPDWLANIVPSWVGVLIAAAVMLVGVVIGMFTLLMGVPSVLRSEAEHILEGAELRAPLTIRTPELLPLAKALRQLSLLSRRQLIGQARREASREDDDESVEQSTTTEATQTDSQPAEPEEPPTPQPTASIIDEPPADDLPAHIFREASIRGDVRTELTEDLIERIGHALAVHMEERGIQTVAVAHDARASSKAIRTSLVKALLAGGRDVIDIGEAPTSLLYFATHETDADSGIMITGGYGSDHINGLKLVFQRQLVTGDGIQRVLELVRSGQRSHGRGHTAKQDMEPDYVDRVAMDVALALPLRVVIDNDFSSSARVAPALFTALDCEVVSINTPEQGPRPEDRHVDSALVALGERVVAEGADIGVLFDGDCLRTVTEKGEAVGTDQLMMLLARDLLERNPGADVVCDVKFSRHFAPFITRAGGRALMSRCGHAFVHHKMRESRALLAGDFAGHIFFEERWLGFDDALYALARLLEVLASASGSFGDLVAELPAAVSTSEIRVPVSPGKGERIMSALLANPEFPGARVTTLDGLRIDYADSWGLVRKATSDSVLSLRFEGNDDASLKRIQAVIRRALLQVAPDLELGF